MSLIRRCEVRAGSCGSALACDRGDKLQRMPWQSSDFRDGKDESFERLTRAPPRPAARFVRHRLTGLTRLALVATPV